MTYWSCSKSFTWTRLSKSVCLFEAKFWFCMCVLVCGLWVCELYFLSLSCPGPLCCIQVNCTSLLLFWKLGHPGSLQQRHLGSEISHEYLAQGHRGKHFPKQLPSEAFQLYLLIGLTNSVFSCNLKNYSLLEQASYTTRTRHGSQTTRSPSGLWPLFLLMVPDGSCTWEGPIPYFLGNSELSNSSSTNNLAAWRIVTESSSPGWTVRLKWVAGAVRSAPAVAHLLWQYPARGSAAEAGTQFRFLWGRLHPCLLSEELALVSLALSLWLMNVKREIKSPGWSQVNSSSGGKKVAKDLCWLSQVSAKSPGLRSLCHASLMSISCFGKIEGTKTAVILGI